MMKMHLMWFCAFSPHAGFGLDGWSGPRTGSGYDWTKPELWQDMAVALERAKFDLIMLGIAWRYRGPTRVAWMLISALAGRKGGIAWHDWQAR